jgi:molybdate transport system regulatory protein
MPKLPASPRTDAALWFRILLPGGALGPGKIALLRAIAEKGSVSAAAKSLRMSHARSVRLVAEINALAADPIIDTRAGGLAGGGASLTPLGLAVLDAYVAIETTVNSAAALPVAALAALLGRSPEGE